MTRRDYLLTVGIVILTLLACIETARRFGNTLECIVELRYSPYMVGTPKDEIVEECRDRHMRFPFRFL